MVGRVLSLLDKHADSFSDTWMQALGEKYVANYSAKGYRMVDIMDADMVHAHPVK